MGLPLPFFKVHKLATKAKAKSKATAKKVVKKEKNSDKPKFFVPDYGAMVREVEKKFHLVGGSMSVEAKKGSFMSTGLLTTDLVLGGGILGGAWYTAYGGEGSAKSTVAMQTSIGAIIAGIPIIEYDDFEGSLAPDYYEAMLYASARGMSFTDVFGIQNLKTGEWELEPKIYKREYSNGEEFFDPVSSMLRKLPDKRFIQGQWFYIFDNTTSNRRIVGSRYSQKLFSKYGKFFVEAENGLPQAIYFTDSYPAMFPEKLDDDDKGAGMAAVARMFAENVPRVLSKLKRKNVAIFGVNQLRLRPATMGNPEYEPAGEAVKFASSCRLKQAAIVPPEGWERDKETYGAGSEKSVTTKGRDTYRYISQRNTKNKVSTPWLKSTQRIWVADGNGQAHGFCQAYDTYNYLKMTGQIKGKRNKWTMPELGVNKPIDWQEFKQLILLKGSALKDACKHMKLKEVPKIREQCSKQVRKGKAMQLYFDNLRAEAERKKDDSDESNGD